jgi:hypothetical protein
MTETPESERPPTPEPDPAGAGDRSAASAKPKAISIPHSEIVGRRLAKQLIDHINKLGGTYLRDQAGYYHVILGGRRILLNDTPDNSLAGLMIEACNVSTVSSAARAAIQRLQVEAARRAGHLQRRRFSALSPDGARLYIPVAGGQLLLVTEAGISSVRNGENLDHFWVEHPYGDTLRYSPADPSSCLVDFERLLVDTQACAVPSMRWLVAMQAGLFPFVRESCPGRFLLELIGPSQTGGKTSGVQRYTLLHGLGEVKGDFTVAALASLGDTGLLVLDNKEQANFTPELIDFLLFLATGAERGRSQVDGRLRPSATGRPVGIFTTIEGAVKAELRARCVQVQYLVKGQTLPRGPIEQEISQRRHGIGSALMGVLMRYLQVQSENRPTPNPIPNFEEHFTALANLLRAFGEVAGKPAQWAEDIIRDWNATLSGAEPDEEELEHPIQRVLSECVTTWPDKRLTVEDFIYKAVAGRLYVTEAADLLTFLQKLSLRDLNLPKNAQGLSRRLNSCKFRSFTFLPTDSEGVPSLKRTSRRKPIGFFLPDDDPLTPT